MIKRKLVIFIGIGVLASAASSTAGSAEVFKAAPPVLEVAKMAPDDRGTDVSNIYIFQVNRPGGDQQNGTYIIFFYLDGQLYKRFYDQRLPFTFVQNFKGLNSGPHQLKAEVGSRDTGDQILAEHAADFNVVR